MKYLFILPSTTILSFPSIDSLLLVVVIINKPKILANKATIIVVLKSTNKSKLIIPIKLQVLLTVPAIAIY